MLFIRVRRHSHVKTFVPIKIILTEFTVFYNLKQINCNLSFCVSSFLSDPVGQSLGFKIKRSVERNSVWCVNISIRPFTSVLRIYSTFLRAAYSVHPILCRMTILIADPGGRAV